MMEVTLNESPVVIPPPTVTITLSYKEACALMEICGRVTGNVKLNTEFIYPLYTKLDNILDFEGGFLRPFHDDVLRAAEGFWESLPDRP